jgi:hypothetical protein
MFIHLYISEVDLSKFGDQDGRFARSAVGTPLLVINSLHEYHPYGKPTCTRINPAIRALSVFVSTVSNTALGYWKIITEVTGRKK